MNRGIGEPSEWAGERLSERLDDTGVTWDDCTIERAKQASYRTREGDLGN